MDDHEVVRYGLRGLLECEPDMVVVGEAGTGDDALRIAREHRKLVDIRADPEPGRDLPPILDIRRSSEE